jgi:hypothetical protein
MSRSFVAAIAVLVALTGVAAAEDRKAAEQFFRLGEKAYQAQNFDAAAQNFEEAYTNFALPEIAFSAAQAYRRWFFLERKPEHVYRAVELYRIYLGKVKSGGRVADAVDALAEMQAELDNLLKSGVEVAPAIAKEFTRIVINPALATEATSTDMQEVKEGTAQEVTFEAMLDGQRVEAYAPINVLPGKHKVTVVAPGYVGASKEMLAAQGTTTIFDIPMQARPAKVTIVAAEDTSIKVDGRAVGTAPIAPLELTAGRHVITLSMRGHNPIAREVSLARGQQLTLRESLQMTTRRKLVPWFLGAAAVATAVAGVSTTFAVIRDSDAADMLYDLRTLGAWTDDDYYRYYRTRTARDRWRTAAYVSGGALALFGGLAAFLYFSDNPNPDSVRVEPLTVPAGGGAAIAGGF